MALGINTNIASLTAQNNLSKSQALSDQALERLSSGLRINSAKDDAAGLAISTRFSAQISGLTVAQRNANDGISYAQTAEGALGEITDALTRIRDLAVQSANDTNSASDRQALNQEVGALIAEINRIAGATQFNGQNILDGSLSDLTFQVGANAGQTISVAGVDARGSKLGAAVYTGSAFARGNIFNGDFKINDVDISLSSGATGADVVSAINSKAAQTGVTAAQDTKTTVNAGAYTAPSSGAATININGVDIDIASGDDIDAAIDAINAKAAQTGVTADKDSSDNLILTDNSGGSISVTDADGVMDSIGTTEEIYEAGIVLSTGVGETITIDQNGNTITDIGLEDGDLTTGESVLNNVDVLTRENASKAITTVDYALNVINNLRAGLGAVQSRFESTISNLASTSENLSAANSRILDADFASETANLAKAQVLQQAGISVLAQANARPQQVLSLLQ